MTWASIEGRTLPVYLPPLKVSKSPFASEERRHEWRQKLNQIEGVDIAEDRIKGRPTIPLRLLVHEDAFAQFRGVYDWVMTILNEHLDSSSEEP